MDKNTNIKDLETLLQESRVEEEIQAILEELDTNDAPDAIEDGQPEAIDADASRESYMPDEDEGDDVEEIVVESLSDEELMQMLDEAGYEPSLENVSVLREDIEVFNEFLGIGYQDAGRRHAKRMIANGDIDRRIKELEAKDPEKYKTKIAKLNAKKQKNQAKIDDYEDKFANKYGNRRRALALKGMAKVIEKDTQHANKTKEQADELKRLQDTNATNTETRKAARLGKGTLKNITDKGPLNPVYESIDELRVSDYNLMKLLEISQYEASVENLLLLKEDKDLLLALYEEVVEGNPKEVEAKKAGFEDGNVEEHEHVYEDGVCKVCGEPEKKEEEIKEETTKTEETTKPIEESFNNIFGILTEEYGMNDAPKAIKSVSSTKMAGKATKNDYMYDEEQADDVEEILIESLSDYEIMQALVECGIEPTIENVMIIREEAEEKEKTKEEQAYEKGQEDYQHDIDLEKAAKKKRRKEIASAVGKIALGTALAAGAGWMATKHGAAEAKGISNLKADVEAKDAKVNDAQAKVDNAEDIAKNDKLDGSVEAKTLDNLDNAHEDLTNAKNAAEVAKSNLRKAQALATTKQAAKVGVTAGGAAVLATSAAKDIKGRKSDPEVDKKQEEIKAKDALEKENKIKEQIKEVKKEIADLKKKIKNEKDPGEASKLNKQLDRKQKQKEDLEKKLTKNEAYNNFNLDSRDVFVEQVSLTIASENNDRLFTEMVNATILANRLRKELLEKYADVSETRVDSILEELGMNDSPSVMKQGTSDDVDAEFDYDDYMTDEVNGNDVVVEAYIPTETVFEMLEKYGFGATEYNVEFLREELEVNDAPVAIKIKHAEEIQAKIARADYFPDETFSDDVKEVLVESGMGDMSNEAITESIVNTALNTIREIIKSHC